MQSIFLLNCINKIHFVFFLFILLLFSQLAISQKTDTLIKSLKLSLGVEFSTQGIGMEFSKQLRRYPRFATSLGYSYFRYLKHQSIELDKGSTIDLFPNIRKQIIWGKIDWYPFKKSKFKLVAGVGYNLIQLYQFDVSTQTGVKSGGLEIGSDDFGIIHAGIRWNNVMPYGGIGFGRDIPHKRVGINVEVGTFYLGKPQLNISYEGFLEGTNLDEEVIKVQKNMSGYRYYPLISLKVRYRITKK